MEDITCVLAQAHPSADQCSSLASWVLQQLQASKGNFATALKAFRSAIEQQDHAAGTVAPCLIQCLLWSCQQEDAAATAVVQHLLLDALAADPAATGDTANRQHAGQLMLLYCNNGTAKLASKVASTFSLSRQDLGTPGWQQLCAAVPLMLQQPSTYKPAVFLMMQFEGLDEVVDRVEVLTQLVADGQDVLAQQWATSLGRDYQVSFVEACVALDRLKPAARAVRQLHLAAEFPNVEALYRQRSLSRLIHKRLWPVALSNAGSDVPLQTQLVCGMAEVGEQALAEEYRQQLGLPPDTLAPPDPAVVAAQEAARREAYLQLELPDGALLWVDDPDSCAAAHQALSGSDALGLDVEWKPSHVAGVTSPAAVLQVASRTHVALFDLLTLCEQHPAALQSCLGPLLSDAAVLKLGFEVSGDLAKLAGSWPAVACFRHVAGVLDLRPLWVAHGLEARQQGGSARALSSVGLSTLCQHLLGKPLDKSQQMSDWTARPLTHRQQQYAALDAYVLPQLFDVLQQRLGPETTAQLVRQHTKTISRPQQTSSEPDKPPNSPPRVAGTTSAPALTPAPAAKPASTSAAVAGDSTRTLANLGQDRVLALLQQHGLQDRYQRLHNIAAIGAPHVKAWDTAAAAGVPVSSVVKTMTLLVEQQPYLIVTRGDQRIDTHKARTRTCCTSTSTSSSCRQPGPTDTRSPVGPVAASAAAAGPDAHPAGPRLSQCLGARLQRVLRSGRLPVAAAAARLLLAAWLGVKRRSIVIAPESAVLRLTGFTSGVPPVGQAGQLRVIVDKRLASTAANTTSLPSAAAAAAAAGLSAAAAAVDTPASSSTATSSRTGAPPPPAAAAAVAGQAAAGVGSMIQQAGYASRGSIGRGNLGGLVAAAALAPSQQQPADHPMLQPASPGCTAADATGNAVSEGPVGTAQHTGDPTSSSSATLLVVQCGAAAVLRLSFEQLLQLSGAAGVADVADAPAEAAGLSTMTGEAAAGVGGPKLQGSPKFLMDSMLGRLCRWLRALGVDAGFVEPGQQGQPQNQHSLIQQIQEAALLQGRLFVTRDQKLASRRDVGGSVFLLGSNEPAGQLAELSKHFGIKLDESLLMSRCGVCNASAYKRISHEEAAAHVNSRLLELVDEFWQCGKCGKCVWMGPKSHAAISLLEGLFADGKTNPTPLQGMPDKDRAEA